MQTYLNIYFISPILQTAHAKYDQFQSVTLVMYYCLHMVWYGYNFFLYRGFEFVSRTIFLSTVETHSNHEVVKQ